MKKPFALVVALVACFTIARAQDYVKYVNTLQGTYSNYGLSYGSTYPTIGLPFAEHFYSPQTNKNGEGWKYQYQAARSEGLSRCTNAAPGWVITPYFH
jgi:putative alpha-1,2-mannosidase